MVYWNLNLPHQRHLRAPCDMSVIAAFVAGAFHWAPAHPWPLLSIAYLAYLTYCALEVFFLEPRRPTLDGLPTPSKLGKVFDMTHLAQLAE